MFALYDTVMPLALPGQVKGEMASASIISALPDAAHARDDYMRLRAARFRRRAASKRAGV